MRALMPSPDAVQAPPPLLLAVVCAPDGVRFVAHGHSDLEILRRLASHVARQAPRQLWPLEARRVRLLLRHGRLGAAVAYYFARVGRRWDDEWLVRCERP